MKHEEHSVFPYSCCIRAGKTDQHFHKGSYIIQISNLNMNQWQNMKIKYNLNGVK